MEKDGLLIDIGEFEFSDFDLDDSYNVSVSEVVTSGTTTGLPDNDTLLSLFSTDILREHSEDTNGSLRWLFVADGVDFDYLAEGETTSLQYQLDLDDGRGGISSRNVTVHIVGSNDRPILLDSAVSGRFNPAGSITQLSGEVMFEDADTSDVHMLSILDVDISGDISGLPDTDIIKQWLSLNSVTTDAGTDINSASWEFSPNGFDFSYLGLEKSLELKYQVAIDNGNGDVIVTPISIIINNSNDAAGALLALEAPVTVEDNPIDIALPNNLFAQDIDGTLSFSAALMDGNPLPDWLLFDGQVFTGTPPENFFGNIGIRVTATNGVSAVSDIFKATSNNGEFGLK